MQKNYLEVGQIVNTHGLKGFLKVVPYTDDMERFEEFKKIIIVYDKKDIEFEIEKVKYFKGTVILKLKGVEHINEAEKYKNCFLKIRREDAKKLEENTYFIADLIGLKVYSEEDKEIGTLVEVFPTGSNDVYVVKDSNNKQILLPAIRSVIKKVDIEAEKIIVDVNGGVMPNGNWYINTFSRNVWCYKL